MNHDRSSIVLYALLVALTLAIFRLSSALEYAADRVAGSLDGAGGRLSQAMLGLSSTRSEAMPEEIYWVDPEVYPRDQVGWPHAQLFWVVNRGANTLSLYGVSAKELDGKLYIDHELIGKLDY